MKTRLFPLCGLLLFTAPARAQVIINPAALDQLAGIVRSPPVQAPAHPALRRPPRPKAKTARAAPALAIPLPPGPAPAPAPVQAAAKPAVPEPQLPRAQVHFGAAGASLPPGAAASLQPFCTQHGGEITIDAYAPADPADPSHAARLSMDRAFALRDALSACGVAAGRIIPRANGAVKTPDPDTATISFSP